METYKLRKIEKDDFNKKYLELLRQLTTIEIDKITKETFEEFVNNLNENHQIYVIEEIEQNIIIGTITIIFEPKIIHTMGIVCHIEDVVVDINFRGLKLSKNLINHALKLAKNNNCYKVILNCKDENVVIYEKNGFIANGNLMSLYL